MVSKLHELNDIAEYEEIDIEKYFKPMAITKEQKKERENVAEDLWWVFLLLFALIRESIESGDLDYAFIYETFRDSYMDAVSKVAELDDYLNLYIESFTRKTLDTTWDNIDMSNPDTYWTSSRRAVGIAVNQANVILNYEDLLRAIRDGKNVKVWHTQNDSKVRKEHAKLEDKKIGILDFYQVGDSMLMFPCDETHCINLKDISNCRCYAKAEYDIDYPTVTEEDFKELMITSVQP